MSDFERSWALVIGINNYTDGIPPLQNAVNDAKSLAELLRQKYGYEVWECLDDAATLENLHNLLSITLPKKITANDRLLFYFAGHGIALNSDEELEGFLIPQDARLRDVQTYLPMTLLHECLNKLPCRHFLGILDCCFAGAFRWSSTNREILAAKTIYKERYERFIADPAWQVITSTSYNQKALDVFAFNNQRGSEGNHSPFAFSLLKALEGTADLYPPSSNGKQSGDGVITATELYLYLRGELELIMEERWQKQTPGIFPLKKHDNGEYIFLPPGHVLNLPSAPPLDESKNPYRGLESFEEEHSRLFFGRQELIEKLHEFVNKQPLTVVLGASGTGKSSLVKAGLIPYIKNLKYCEQDWVILSPMRPGESPFRALNNVLTSEKLLPVDVSNGNYQQAIENLKARMTVWCKRNPKKKLLFVVDQLEEVITLCRNKQEQENFLNFLALALEKYPGYVRIVITLRSDFEAQFRDIHLRNYWQQSRFIVAPMTREELRKAIEEPAIARVMYFEPHSLVEQLLDDVAQMPGALPLLSFTLSELYLRYLKSCRDGLRDNRTITQQDYEELGGVARSLTQRADCEYDQLVKLNIAYAQTIRHVMLRMIAVGGVDSARRRVQLTELEYPPGENERVQCVIYRFTDARLLVKGEDIDGNLYVEPAHDALVHGWHKLLVWKHEDEESLILQRQLTPATLDWLNEKSAQFLWNNNPRLSLLKQILNSNDNWLNKVEAEFVRQSLKRKNKVLTRNCGITIVAALLLISTTTLAIIKAIDAQNKLLESNILLAENLFTSGRELEALEKATETGKSLLENKSTVNEDTKIKVLTAWQQIAYKLNERNRLSEFGVSSVSFSPKDKIIASGGTKGIIKLWYTNGESFQSLTQHQKDSSLNVFKVIFSKNGETLISASNQGINIWRRQLNGKFSFYKSIPDQDGIISLALSPDERILATGGLGTQSSIKLRNLNGKILNTLTGHTNAVNGLSFSTDGQTIASASADTTIKLWRTQDNKAFKTIKESSSMFAVSFIDSQTIAYAGANGAIKLRNLKKGEFQLDFPINHYKTIPRLAVSPNGKMIASASDDATINIWSLNGTLSHTLRGHQEAVKDISFSPDSKTIASTSADNTIRIWSFDVALAPKGGSLGFSPNNQMIVIGDNKTVKLWPINGKLVYEFKPQHKGLIHRVSFSPDGKTIASASADNTVNLWDIHGNLLKTLQGHKNRVISISFSPDSKMIVSGSSDTTVKLWDINGTLLKTFSGHQKIVTSVSFSPDGKMIASGSRDSTIKLWNLHGKEIQTIKGHKKPVLSVNFSPDGKMIVSSSEDKTVIIWHLNTIFGHLDVQQTKPFETKDNVLLVKFNPNSKSLALAHENRLELWNLDGSLLDFQEKDIQNVQDISFSRDGKIFALSNAGEIIMLDFDLDNLFKVSCSWLHDYLAFNKNRQNSMEKLCNRSAYLPR